jgi:hypothetical protein
MMLLTISYWLWHPYKIIEFKSFCTIEDLYGEIRNVDMCVVNNVVKRGEYLNVKINYTKYINLVASDTIIELVNDRYITLVTKEQANLPCGNHEKTLSIYIPQNIWPGRYHLSMTRIYKPNPIRTIIIKIESNQFEVK